MAHRAVAAAEGSPNDLFAGAKATVAACTGAATQKWVIGQTSYNDFGALYNIGTRTVLTDPGGSTTNGTQLVTGPRDTAKS